MLIQRLLSVTCAFGLSRLLSFDVIDRLQTLRGQSCKCGKNQYAHNQGNHEFDQRETAGEFWIDVSVRRHLRGSQGRQ